MDFKESKTFENLMRAFAGESQARNRYTLAAETAKREGYHVIEGIFNYTANQEKGHAEQFVKLLRKGGVNNVNICAGYPVDLKDNTLDLLKDAAHNEQEESDNIYVNFSEVAKQDRKSTRLNSSHANISYAVFCLKKNNDKFAPVITN